MLDEIHESLPSSRDQNGYTLGRIGTHNIVVAVMPSIDNNRAASIAMQLLNDFRSIRFGLLVRIGDVDYPVRRTTFDWAMWWSESQQPHLAERYNATSGRSDQSACCWTHRRRFMTAATVRKDRFLAIHLE